MTGADRLICAAATMLLAFTLTAAPAKAQFGGGTGGGQDMMTQAAPMLEMMKAKMGKRRFAMLMKTMGPMMSQMTQGGGLGGMSGGLGGFAPQGLGTGSGFDIGSIMSMVGPMMRMVNLGGGHHRHHRHK
jgi:hypothetical protein